MSFSTLVQNQLHDDKSVKHQINYVSETESQKTSKARCEQLTKVNVGDTEAYTQIIFEPQPCSIAKLDRGLVYASCINKVADDSIIILSVLKLTDNDVTIEENTEIGELEEAEILEEKEDSLTLKNGEINWHKIKIGHDLSKKELIQELGTKIQISFLKSDTIDVTMVVDKIGITTKIAFDKQHYMSKAMPFSNLSEGQVTRDFMGPEKFKVFNESVDKLWKDFLSIYNDLRGNSLSPKSTQGKTKEWLELFKKSHITAYIHAFCSHLHQFQRLNGYINLFNLQGLEKLNDETTSEYFKATNKKTIDQLLHRRLRIDDYLYSLNE
ncbi:hypothetical protein BpHYR1_016150 [Brachionus plicatilis]|uniref:Uncharacterized protein n=1 Tax=Brachionus plicatilis TaxID=10195 RepID=A0A3M7RP85_BRAPC|nr:hypothetical protein BpHYR1_016150 [Brachionus plicatilis]